MIELGADIDHRWRGETPFFKAARGLALDVMDALLNHGTDINGKNSENKTPLICSAQGGREASVRWLIVRLTAVDRTGASMLGCMKGIFTTADDIDQPTTSESDWKPSL